MRTYQQQMSPAKGLSSERLLYITDLINDSDETLESACVLAERNGVDIEVIHVVDVERSASSPDAQMGIQYRLDMLARRLKNLRRSAESRILFGSPENVIAKRALTVRAKLVAFGTKDSSPGGLLHRLVDRIRRRVSCPVVIIPATVGRGGTTGDECHRGLLDSSKWIVAAHPVLKGGF